MFHVGPIWITRELVQRTPRGSAGGRNSTSQSYFGYWLFLIICFALVGCKTLSLPAINPNGGTIFSGQSQKSACTVFPRRMANKGASFALASKRIWTRVEPVVDSYC